MDKNTTHYLDAAKHYRCRIFDLFEYNAFAIDFGNHRYLFRGAATPFNDAASIDVAKNKFVMNRMLADADIPVPHAVAMGKESYALGEVNLSKLNYPVVAKPTLDTSRGDGVLCNIQNEATLREYLERMLVEHEYMSVETFKDNLNHYRVTVLEGKVIGILKREAASITGDGKHTIKQLVDQKNAVRQKQAEKTTLNPIEYDHEMTIRLKELGLTLDDVPKADQAITLCYTINSSRGGNVISLGEKIHPVNAMICAKACQALNMDYCGVDLACTDIMQPITETEGYIIEMNYNPDITIHEVPLEGPTTHVARAVVKCLIKRHRLTHLKQRFHIKRILLSPFVRFGLLVVVVILIKHWSHPIWALINDLASFILVHIFHQPVH